MSRRHQPLDQDLIDRILTRSKVGRWYGFRDDKLKLTGSLRILDADSASIGSDDPECNEYTLKLQLAYRNQETGFNYTVKLHLQLPLLDDTREHLVFKFRPKVAFWISHTVITKLHEARRLNDARGPICRRYLDEKKLPEV